MKIISASIDLTKIDKSRIVAGKTGAKYYNISIIVNDEKDKYGNDVAISEGQSKDERERKEKRKYIGNGKTVWPGAEKTTQQNDTSQTSENQDLPF